jgi:hypothetical protein
MGQSSNYYPQGNGLVESTNKTLIQILKNTIDLNQNNWHLKLTDALWESKLTPKEAPKIPHICWCMEKKKGCQLI